LKQGTTDEANDSDSREKEGELTTRKKEKGRKKRREEDLRFSEKGLINEVGTKPRAISVFFLPC